MNARNKSVDNSLYKCSTNDLGFMELQRHKLKNIQKNHLIKQLNALIGIKHSWDIKKLNVKQSKIYYLL